MGHRVFFFILSFFSSHSDLKRGPFSAAFCFLLLHFDRKELRNFHPQFHFRKLIISFSEIIAVFCRRSSFVTNVLLWKQKLFTVRVIHFSLWTQESMKKTSSDIIINACTTDIEACTFINAFECIWIIDLLRHFQALWCQSAALIISSLIFLRGKQQTVFKLSRPILVFFFSSPNWYFRQNNVNHRYIFLCMFVRHLQIITIAHFHCTQCKRKASHTMWLITFVFFLPFSVGSWKSSHSKFGNEARRVWFISMHVVSKV